MRLRRWDMLQDGGRTSRSLGGLPESTVLSTWTRLFFVLPPVKWTEQLQLTAPLDQYMLNPSSHSVRTLRRSVIRFQVDTGQPVASATSEV